MEYVNLAIIEFVLCKDKIFFVFFVKPQDAFHIKNARSEHQQNCVEITIKWN